MRFKIPLLLSALCFIGCPVDGAWLLPETDAITMARAELSSRGVQATVLDYKVMNVSACGGTAGCVSVSFTLDGWDPVKKIGFEYISEDDPDFGIAPQLSQSNPSEALQSAVDQAVAGQATIFILHQWAHETESLCRDQFVSVLRARLDERGIK